MERTTVGKYIVRYFVNPHGLGKGFVWCVSGEGSEPVMLDTVEAAMSIGQALYEDGVAVAYRVEYLPFEC